MNRDKILEKIKGNFNQEIDNLSDDILNQLNDGKVQICLKPAAEGESGGRMMHDSFNKFGRRL